MKISHLFEEYLEHLFLGKRCEARELIFAAQDRGIPSEKLLKMIIWPAMEQIAELYRQNRISRIVEHMATRINRMLADQLHASLARKPKHGKRMVITCGRGEIPELGAQIIADLFEANGWSVWLLGAGVPNDEIVKFISKIGPDILCIYGTTPPELPDIRRLNTYVREMEICPDMQILVSGGVFNRAEGLAEEVKADLYAPGIYDVIETIDEHPIRIPKADVPEPGRRRKRKRKKPPTLTRKSRKRQKAGASK